MLKTDQSVKKLKNIDISQKMNDFMDHDQAEHLEDRVQEFKSRFQNIRKKLRSQNKLQLQPAESNSEVILFQPEFLFNW